MKQNGFLFDYSEYFDLVPYAQYFMENNNFSNKKGLLHMKKYDLHDVKVLFIFLNI